VRGFVSHKLSTPKVLDRRQLADEQTEAEHDATFSDNTGSKIFLAIDQEVQRLSTNADAVIQNPQVGWLKHLRRDAKGSSPTFSTFLRITK
jgi:hypothetical protein